VGANEVCIAFLTSNPSLRFEDVYRLFPEVADRLTVATSRALGAVTAMRKLDTVHRGRCVLIGDASGSVDAITGEGLSLAFRQALALREALRKNDIVDYEQEHQRIQRVPRTMAQLLLLMDRHLLLRSLVLRMFSLHPALFQQFLNVHTGVTPFSRSSDAILAAGSACTLSTSTGNGETAITESPMPAQRAQRTSQSHPEHEV
jgi:flavin-dependent dehydrogenase